MEKEYKNLYQLHWQEIKHPYKVVEFIAQKEIKTNAEMQEWLKDVSERHPLPEGMCWSIHDWDSKDFVKADLEVAK